MARYPKAAWRPIPENSYQGACAPRLAIVHSAAANISTLYDYFRRSDVAVESTFFVKWDGGVEQYLDTLVRSDANRDANDFAVSIETEDDGDPNVQPWSGPQIDALTELLRWLNLVHPAIPLRLADRWDGSGIGYHSQWGAPSPWTPVRGKTCPGTVRIRQFHDVLLPRLVSTTTPQEDLLMAAALNDDDARRCLIRQWYIEFLGRAPSGSEQNAHLEVFRQRGADLTLAGIFDSPEAVNYRTKTPDAR